MFLDEPVQLGKVQPVPFTYPYGEQVESLVQVLNAPHSLDSVEIPLSRGLRDSGLGKLQRDISDELLILIFRFYYLEPGEHSRQSVPQPGHRVVVLVKDNGETAEASSYAGE